MRIYVTGCKICNEELQDSPERLHEFHVGIHFGDSFDWYVQYKGETIHDCDEVLPGDGGWARRLIFFGKEIRVCPCGSGEPFMYKDYSDHYSVQKRIDLRV